MKIQLKGFTIVGLFMLAAGLTLAYFVKDMSSSALMGESAQYKPILPAVPKTDITQAPQCLPGYDKTWVGCQKLGQ